MRQSNQPLSVSFKCSEQLIIRVKRNTKKCAHFYCLSDSTSHKNNSIHTHTHLLKFVRIHTQTYKYTNARTHPNKKKTHTHQTDAPCRFVQVSQVSLHHYTAADTHSGPTPLQ